MRAGLSILLLLTASTAYGQTVLPTMEIIQKTWEEREKRYDNVVVKWTSHESRLLDEKGIMQRMANQLENERAKEDFAAKRRIPKKMSKAEMEAAKQQIMDAAKGQEKISSWDETFTITLRDQSMRCESDRKFIENKDFSPVPLLSKWVLHNKLYKGLEDMHGQKYFNGQIADRQDRHGKLTCLMPMYMLFRCCETVQVKDRVVKRFEDYNGCRCVVTELSGPTWLVRQRLDPARDYAIVTSTLEGNGKAISEIVFEYDNDADFGWVPKGWTEVRDQGSTHNTTVSEITSLTIGQPIADSVFDLEFPAGTMITDARGFDPRKGGLPKVRQIMPDREPNRGTWTWVWVLSIAVLIAAACYVLYRYKHRVA